MPNYRHCGMQEDHNAHDWSYDDAEIWRCEGKKSNHIAEGDTLNISKEQSLGMAVGIALNLGEELRDAFKYGTPQGMFKKAMHKIRKLMYYIEKADLP